MAEGTGKTSDGGEPRRKRRRRRRPRPKGSPTGKVATAGGMPAVATQGTADASGSGTKKVGAKDASKAQTKGRRKDSPGARRATDRKASRGPRTPTVKEVSAGGVVYRRDDGQLEVVLASRRTRRGQLAWGLAKGGIEPDESMEDAAVREVREETGIEAVIEASLGDTKYMYVWEDVRIRKTVHFFLMRATGGDVGDRDDEMEEVRWFPMERALKRAAYRGERDILRRAADILG